MKGGGDVADDETAETETAEPSTAELDQRITGIESKVDLILDKLGGERDRAHDAAQQHTEDRLDRPSNIADEIRAQLDAQRKADARAASEQNAADRLAAVESAVTGMAEKVPETPMRRVEKFMGWR